MAQTRAYRLLPRRVSAAQTRMDSLVSALWDGIFPGLGFGPNHRFERVFAKMPQHPEQICPYYFDQNNLQLHCFQSWADLQSERRRSAERHRCGEADAGVYLSRLCQLQDLQTGGSITTQTLMHLMYDYSG